MKAKSVRQKLIVGLNDLLSVNPVLSSEWNYDKNIKMPTDYTAGSVQKVWWRCSFGHEWEATIYSRNQGVGCPYCSNKKVLKGFNDLATTNPEIAIEWNYEKNIEKTPEKYTAGSSKKVWWKCTKGHEWEASIATRKMGIGCPVCSNKKVLFGYNDLETLNPKLANEWNHEKNGELKPSMFVPGSGRKVWWKCSVCNNEWKENIADRNRGVGCPFCRNLKIKVGYNDLETTDPFLANEWNYEKNGVLKPTMIVAGSKKKVWWKCSRCGHEWMATCDDRHRNGRGCPKCNRRNQTSFPEQALFFYIQKNYPDAVNGYDEVFDGKMEIDIFIPSLKLGIEYDGTAWHSTDISRQRERNKYNICKEHGIRLIRIKENKNHNRTDSSDILLFSKDTLDETITQLIKYIEIPDSIDTERDRLIIIERYYASFRERSFDSKYPDLSEQWDQEKNGKLEPSMFLPNSTDKMWWKCEKGHSYQATFAHRAEGKGCPYCAGQKVLVGFNDIATTAPELMNEWDYEKNVNISPDEISSGSGIKVWWKCKMGHSWKTAPLYRKMGGCPYCGGKKVLQGFNDLVTVNPELSLEWNYKRNGNMRPENYTAGSNQRVWWVCPKCGKEWQTNIYSRNKGTGCPICSKQKKEKDV